MKEEFGSTTALPAEGRCDHPVAELAARHLAVVENCMTAERAEFHRSTAALLTSQAKRIEELENLVQATVRSDQPHCVHPVSSWQPIETAPKDGTWFWAFYPKKQPTCFQDQWKTARWVEDFFHEGYPAFLDAAEHEEFDQPTHWMPLPASPDTSGDRTASAPRKTVVEPNLSPQGEEMK
jgi:hypothetical protein